MMALAQKTIAELADEVERELSVRAPSVDKRLDNIRSLAFAIELLAGPTIDCGTEVAADVLRKIAADIADEAKAASLGLYRASLGVGGNPAPLEYWSGEHHATR